jgi:hypothetical protein
VARGPVVMEVTVVGTVTTRSTTIRFVE